ncbi:FAD dependent oxidoreductase [Pseudomassariella vexata]|uniref:FAD dependent oxidoreductase n=1 Tax=Pseudomassariella vexata TaxID=1141098 RepID=A0A1Y2DLI1_9PEZI|nr:FAD dependent oxidoreductase [Pseudomassariella vexata]ORY60004.1 FAD dependent oxidoreductase [Pseudomassariella vexata]
MPSDAKQIIIIGGGIVGISTAYYLLQHPQYDSKKDFVIVIEAGHLGESASGKAGGFLASWATPKCLAPLSFKLHAELAKDLGGDKWGYRRVHAAEIKLKIELEEPDINVSGKAPKNLDWLLPGSIEDYTEVGTPVDSAQAHPKLLLQSMASAVISGGASIILNTSVSRINYDDTGSVVKSVTVTGDAAETIVPATHILVAAGPWTPKLIPSIHLLAPKGHSVVFNPSRDLSSHVLFPVIETEGGGEIEADIYPRPKDSLNGFETAYSSGPDYYDSLLPSSVETVEVESVKCDEVITAISGVSQQLREGGVIARQACYKAQIRKHEEGEEVGPIVGPMEDVKGLWVATGFDEWGIQNAPGAGLVTSQMIIEGKAWSADVDSLHPRHYVAR